MVGGAAWMKGLGVGVALPKLDVHVESKRRLYQLDIQGKGLGLARMTHVEQFASKVVNFSSQYGTAGTSSYTASNLASGLNVYPKYGDYTEAFVLVS